MMGGRRDERDRGGGRGRVRKEEEEKREKKREEPRAQRKKLASSSSRTRGADRDPLPSLEHSVLDDGGVDLVLEGCVEALLAELREGWWRTRRCVCVCVREGEGGGRGGEREKRAEEKNES